MSQMNMIEAIRSGLDVMMDKDPSVVLMGEDIGYFGGVFRCTDGLQRKYGEHRVIDAPISEGGIIGAAIGMGVNGLRPVPEIQFADYIYPGFDQIVSELARLRYRSSGEFFSPVTIRTPCGGGIRGGQTHSQSPEAIFAHVSGIKIVMPSNPYDAKGLLISSIESDDPIVFFEPKRIYNGPFDGDPEKPAVSWASHPKGEVPEGHYTVPIGEAEVIREGNELTIITYGTLVHVAEAAADETGVDCEIVLFRRSTPIRSQHRSTRPAVASSRTKPPVLAASAPRSRRVCRRIASITLKHRLAASPGGTRPTRMRSSGSTSLARSGSLPASEA
jgi:2-oxoisovalerate dehydrogenase E1 component beta subunit